MQKQAFGSAFFCARLPRKSGGRVAEKRDAHLCRQVVRIPNERGAHPVMTGRAPRKLFSNLLINNASSMNLE